MAERLEEIRVRVGQPIEFCYGSDNCYLIGKEKEQMFCSEKDYRRWEKDLYHASEADLREMLNYISNYSLYAYKEEIKQGISRSREDTGLVWQGRPFWWMEKLQGSVRSCS